MWRNLQQRTEEHLELPEVVDGRCVHSLVEQASCRACAEACPVDAWVIDDEMLGIDTERCDGCGLCVPACPQSAIEQHYSPAIRVDEDYRIALAYCMHSSVERIFNGRMPCLHVLSTQDLIRLALDGVTHLIACSDHCDQCARGNAERLDKRVAEVNALLASRGMQTLDYRKKTSTEWILIFRKTVSPEKGVQLDRRAFFRRAADAATKLVAEEDRTGFTPPGALLPASSDGHPLPYVPIINPACCTGCDACTRLCPHQAIELELADSGTASYRITAERCSGCRICLDVCESAAITVATRCLVETRRVPLKEARCRVCGIAFHLPHAVPDTEKLCPICDKTNHYRNLFQVLG